MDSENCRYKLLHFSSFGEVGLCLSCGCLRVEIGILLAVLSKETFELILEDLVDSRVYYFEDLDEDEIPEKVNIFLNDNNLFLNLTLDELDELIELFEIARHMLEVNEILDCCK